jgi:hypothetical protein
MSHDYDRTASAPKGLGVIAEALRTFGPSHNLLLKNLVDLAAAASHRSTAWDYPVWDVGDLRRLATAAEAAMQALGTIEAVAKKLKEQAK